MFAMYHRSVRALFLVLQAIIASAVFGGEPEAEPPGYLDTPLLPNSTWRVHDRNRPQPPSVTPADNPTAPPSDAIVLFDGKDLSQWVGAKPEGLEAGCLNILKAGQIQTKEHFGDCQLHIEWSTPTAPDDRMRWGNSGIFFQGQYELQIIESRATHIYADGITAALYGQTPPLVNASRPPGQWQTFDVIYTAPRFDGDKLQKPAYFTVLHNGVLVQYHQACLGATRHREVPTYTPHAPKGPLAIQQHGSPVLFRNIWLRPLQLPD
jgi:hypothetical protein